MSIFVQSSQCRLCGCMIICYHVEPLPRAMAFPIKAQIEVLKKETCGAIKRAFKASRRASEREKRCTEAFTKVKHLKENIRRTDKMYASKKNRLAKACIRSNKAIKKAK